MLFERRILVTSKKLSLVGNLFSIHYIIPVYLTLFCMYGNMTALIMCMNFTIQHSFCVKTFLSIWIFALINRYIRELSFVFNTWSQVYLGQSYLVERLLHKIKTEFQKSFVLVEFLVLYFYESSISCNGDLLLAFISGYCCGSWCGLFALSNAMV